MPNIFKRISDVLAANLNDLIDRVEDPERMVKQIIREMEDNIRIAEEGVIDALASEKQLQKDLEQHRHQAATWRQRAEEALRADQEDLARAALTRKRTRPDHHDAGTSLGRRRSIPVNSKSPVACAGGKARRSPAQAQHSGGTAACGRSAGISGSDNDQHTGWL